MKSLRAALNHRASVPRGSTRALAAQIPHAPRSSLTALLRRAGPFEGETHGLPFDNVGLPFTEGDVAELRRRYTAAADVVGTSALLAVRAAVAALNVPVVGGLPGAVGAFVVQRVGQSVRDRVLDLAISSIPGQFGRCGGMAFTALDFFALGWSTERLKQPAPGSPLYRYVWKRLLDSLELNLVPFLERVVTLHVLPAISPVASAALGAAAGSIGGPVGAALGAFIAGKDDVLGLGGADALMDGNRDNLGRLRELLREHAAWPVGFVYGSAGTPWDNHQVLATKLLDTGPGRIRLFVHDNNLFLLRDKPEKEYMRVTEYLDLDMNGSELRVADVQYWEKRDAYPHLKSVLCEDYRPAIPWPELQPSR